MSARHCRFDVDPTRSTSSTISHYPDEHILFAHQSVLIKYLAGRRCLSGPTCMRVTKFTLIYGDGESTYLLLYFFLKMFKFYFCASQSLFRRVHLRGMSPRPLCSRSLTRSCGQIVVSTIICIGRSIKIPDEMKIHIGSPTTMYKSLSGKQKRIIYTQTYYIRCINRVIGSCTRSRLHRPVYILFR